MYVAEPVLSACDSSKGHISIMGSATRLMQEGWTLDIGTAQGQDKRQTGWTKPSNRS